MASKPYTTESDTLNMGPMAGSALHSLGPPKFGGRTGGVQGRSGHAKMYTTGTVPVNTIIQPRWSNIIWVVLVKSNNRSDSCYRLVQTS